MAEDVPTTGLPEPGHNWDFFLAHAGPDLNVARRLKRGLEPPAKAFLDDDNLTPGDAFDLALAEAQQASLISVVIISPNTQAAYYQREEIAAAIQMAREDPHTHRVVPIFLDATQLSSRQMPYGLRLRHGLKVPATGDLGETSQRLLKTLAEMKKFEAKKVVEVEKQKTAIQRIEGGAKSDVLAGLTEVTKFVRPLWMTLLILFVLMTVLLVVSLLLPGLGRDERMLAVTVLGGFCAALLACLLGLTALSLKHAQRIAEGNINGG